jgi:GNAT superfamily N-acetyltransferase
VFQLLDLQDYMEITKATLNNLIEAMFLIRQCGDDLEEQNIMQWDRNNPNVNVVKDDIENGALYIVKNNNVPIATISVIHDQFHYSDSIKWNDHRGKALIIQRFAVYPYWQGKGIGRKLMDFAEEYAVKNLFTSIRIEIQSDNTRAINFFKIREYTPIGTYIDESRQKTFSYFEKPLTGK